MQIVAGKNGKVTKRYYFKWNQAMNYNCHLQTFHLFWEIRFEFIYQFKPFNNQYYSKAMLLEKC